MALPAIRVQVDVLPGPITLTEGRLRIIRIIRMPGLQPIIIIQEIRGLVTDQIHRIEQTRRLVMVHHRILKIRIELVLRQEMVHHRIVPGISGAITVQTILVVSRDSSLRPALLTGLHLLIVRADLQDHPELRHLLRQDPLLREEELAEVPGKVRIAE